MTTPFTVHTGVAAPLLRRNIDTDAIIPSREMKRVSKDGLGEGLFAAWRYTMPGGREPNPEFVLNRPEYAGTSILLSGDNFGCGSSREHAVWALREYGIRAVIAGSFGAIFHTNCVRNGILPLQLAEDRVEALAQYVQAAPQQNCLTVDLQRCRVMAGALEFPFEVDGAEREMLLKGLDPISMTLQLEEDIQAFEDLRRQQHPWAFQRQEG